MALTRKRGARVVGCVVLCLVVWASIGNSAAQSPRPIAGRASAVAASSGTAEHPHERADVARFRKRVEAALAEAGPDQGVWGVLVTDAANGEVLYALHADNYFTPASDAKLFTTALALATLGPDYRVRTTIEASGMPDARGLLTGNLTLVGRGDANLSNRKFPFGEKEEREGPPEKVLAELADAVVARGVKQIDGGIIADDSVFQAPRFPSGWIIDDMLWSYGAAVSALDVNDNTFALDVSPAETEGAPAVTVVEPPVDFYTIENAVRTTAPGSEEKLAVAREPGSRIIRVSGTIPTGKPRKLVIAVEEPAEYAAALLARLLEARGVQISGTVRARHTTDPDSSAAAPSILAEHISPTLAEDIRFTNKISENLNAELLLLLAAHEKTGAATRDDALKFAADFFKIAGIADGDVVLNDGSGLSRHDLVTPRAVEQLLRYAASRSWGELYRSTLPVAGEDGTLSERMKNTPAAGRVFAKTGTMDHVNALSGYATTLRGAHLIFSILANNNNLRARPAEAVVDAITVAMVEELGEKPEVKRKK